MSSSSIPPSQWDPSKKPTRSSLREKSKAIPRPIAPHPTQPRSLSGRVTFAPETSKKLPRIRENPLTRRLIHTAVENEKVKAASEYIETLKKGYELSALQFNTKTKEYEFNGHSLLNLLLCLEDLQERGNCDLKKLSTLAQDFALKIKEKNQELLADFPQKPLPEELIRYQCAFTSLYEDCRRIIQEPKSAPLPSPIEEDPPIPFTLPPPSDRSPSDPEWIDATDQKAITAYVEKMETQSHRQISSFSMTTGFSLTLVTPFILNADLSTEQLTFEGMLPKDLLIHLEKRLATLATLPLAQQIKTLQYIFAFAQKFKESLVEKPTALNTQLDECYPWESKKKQHLSQLISLCHTLSHAFTNFCTDCKALLHHYQGKLKNPSEMIIRMSGYRIHSETSNPPLQFCFVTPIKTLTLTTDDIDSVALNFKFHPHSPEELLTCLQNKVEHTSVLPYEQKITNLKQSCAIANAFKTDLLSISSDLQKKLEKAPDSNPTLKKNLASLIDLSSLHFNAFDKVFIEGRQKLTQLLKDPPR